MSFGKLGDMGRGFGRLGALGSAGSIAPLPPPVPVPTTFDPAGASTTNVLSNGNLTLSNPTGGGSSTFVRSLMSVSSGKYCATFTVVAGPDSTIEVGFADSSAPLSTRLENTNVTLGALNDGSGNIYSGAGFTTIGAIGLYQTPGDVVTVCLDQGARKFWMKVNNGLWNQDSLANPATGVNGKSLTVGMTNATFLAVCMFGAHAGITMNPNPAGAPAGFGGWVTNPNIDVLVGWGESELTGHQVDQSTSYKADPNVIAWNGSAWGQYKPGIMTGFSVFGLPTTAWAEELSYIQAYRSANPTKPFAVGKLPGDGTYLYQSSLSIPPTGDSGSTMVYDWNVNSAGELYSQSLSRVTSMLAALVTLGYSPTVRIFVWDQGINDAGDTTRAAAWQTNAAALIAGVRAAGWLSATAKVVLMRTRRGNVGSDTVRVAQMAIAAADTGGPQWIIEQDDLAVEADLTHSTKASQITRGQRLWAVDQGTYTQPTNTP